MSLSLQPHRYALGVTLRRLALQPFSSLANVMVIALALAIPLLVASTLLSLQPVARQLSTDPELTVFTKVGSSTDVARNMAQRIERDFRNEVAKVRVITREEALAALKRNPSYADVLAVLPGNPLPDAIVVTLRGADLARRSPELADTWRKWDGVDMVQLDSAWVQRMEALLRFGNTALGLLAAVVAVSVLAAVFNTVRMQALSQRDEITAARLVGATESFVRRPFLYLGAFTCAIAAGVAIGASALAMGPLNGALADLAKSYGVEFFIQLPPPLWLLGFVLVVTLLGAFSARWSVTRTTRF